MALSEKFLKPYKTKKPPFGPIGEFTFYRCVSIDTPVLCADLVWRPAGDIPIGMKIVGFDEEANPRRKIVDAYVTDNSIEEADCVQIQLEDGTLLYSTPDHKWLAKVGADHKLRWVYAKDLLNATGRKDAACCYLPKYADVWEEDHSYEGGYLAAAFDGEGSLESKGELSFAQVDNDMLKHVCAYLDKFGFKYSVSEKKASVKFGSSKTCYTVRIYGHRQVLKFLGMFRPKRLLSLYLNSTQVTALQTEANGNSYKKVVDVKPAGKKKIAMLSTSCKTHITAGFPSHNTYSRWLEDKGRREYWWETCKRVVEYNCILDPQVTPEEKEALFDALFHMEVFPAGRQLWIGGTRAVEMDGFANFNSFHPDTEFITRDGIKRLGDYNEGDKVQVLSDHGAWRDATVVVCGNKELYELKIARGKSERVIYTTADHRWWVNKRQLPRKEREEKVTTELQPGDRLSMTRRYQNTKLSPCRVAIQHGIVFGDGSFNRENGTCFIHLHSDSTQLLPCFTTGTVLEKGAKGGELSSDVEYVTALPWNWKQLPDLQANAEYLLGFLMGWFAADGGCSSNVALYNKDASVLEWARSAFAMVGIYTTEVSLVREKSPFDGSDKPLYKIGLYKEYLDGDFFLKENHRQAFYKHDAQPEWRVVSVTATGRVEKTMCVSEPETESFALANGILTRNCTFTTIEKLDDFSEIFYLLMVGAGVGVSVQRKYWNFLPVCRNFHPVVIEPYNPVPKHMRVEFTKLIDNDGYYTIIVGDSKEGWASALSYFLTIMCSKSDRPIRLIVDNVRPRGERLKTFGGFASGPQPLMRMFRKIAKILQANDGVWNSVKVLDVFNMIEQAVVVGGVRRSSGIALGDEQDDSFVTAKINIPYIQPMIDEIENSSWSDERKQKALIELESKDLSHRYLSNNSIVFESKPSRERLMAIFESILINGEPGFVNAVAARLRRKDWQGMNPCVEILLRSKGVCNLTEVVCPNATDLEEAVRMAVRMGLRTTMVNLRFPDWDRVQKEDRLLGVSLTGWQDYCEIHKLTPQQKVRLLKKLRRVAREEAREYAFALRVPEPLLVTTVKPSGTLSKLPGVSSGAHFNYAEYMVQRIRITATDPLLKVMEELNYPICWEVNQSENNGDTKVIEFPIKNRSTISSEKVTALEQLEEYRLLFKHWAEHNVSFTCYFRREEVEEIVEWLLKNWNDFVAVSFLPRVEHNYKLAPWEEITKEEYEQRIATVRPFDPELLRKYETSEEHDILDAECEGGACPIK